MKANQFLCSLFVGGWLVFSCKIFSPTSSPPILSPVFGVQFTLTGVVVGVGACLTRCGEVNPPGEVGEGGEGEVDPGGTGTGAICFNCWRNSAS